MRDCIIHYARTSVTESPDLLQQPTYCIMEALRDLFQQVVENHSAGGNITTLDPNKLRVMLFMHYYATQKEQEPYGPYCKGDSSEFLENILELTHHCLNDDKNKKSPEDKCKMCFVHQNIQLNLTEKRRCPCNPDPNQKQILAYYHNNFKQLVNAQTIITECN